MKATYHTPKGVFTIDTETVSEDELTQLGIKRGDLPKSPRDLEKDFDDLKNTLKLRGVISYDD